MNTFGKYPTRNSEAKKRRQAIEKKLAYKKYLKTLKRLESWRTDNCECGLDTTGNWSDKVFDRFGCSCPTTWEAQNK